MSREPNKADKAGDLKSGYTIWRYIERTEWPVTNESKIRK